MDGQTSGGTVNFDIYNSACLSTFTSTLFTQGVSIFLWVLPTPTLHGIPAIVYSDCGLCSILGQRKV